ncbi:MULTISPECIES: hypothetical protein [Hymenobacter]|uniref:Uncharacterized protein n=1 Tax=Hymenobacter jejuensis TaxID=2502781 RepID=A0A5B8A4X3_9BACT|nr:MULTISPECIES: hypothetical protein [Hymenobacter]MBC6990254.1 hypothetical protein [Hymenobacter sp. BT491]QDA62267.1 hypothetical protein FHG12_20145 [Hymenobacter jejuensis]
MILDNLFGSDDNGNENEKITENTPVSKNERLENEKDYKEEESNGKVANDPSALRNTGAQGYTQRSNQKDQLENLHIGGDETHPQGGNEHHDAGEQAQGPGFEVEGTYELDHSVRSGEQKFGDDKKTPGEPSHSETISGS